MDKDSRIFVAGHRGMVGSAIVRSLKAKGYRNIVMRTRQQVPLDNQAEVDAFFEAANIEYVFLAAARVGGIAANMKYGGDFIQENLRIQTNVIDAARRFGVKRLLFLGSSCIYPREAVQPLVETALLTGPLEGTNLPYAVAKIAGKVMCDAYKQQFGFDAFTVMPSNVYGIGDNFHPENSHLVAGMMRRMHEAKKENAPQVVVWGTGAPLRELIFSEDLADACVFLMARSETPAQMINVGSGHEISVKELAHLIADVVGYGGALVFDTDKPDGTPRKIMDNSIMKSIDWQAETPLKEGLAHMYEDFLALHEVI